jgi:autotransporter-associated beta strand protein
MKNTYATTVALALLGAILLPASASANTAESLQAADANGTSSITGTTNWTPGTTVAPTNSLASTYDYAVAYTLRTPTGSGNYTILADSVSINSGGSLAFKGPATNTFNNLILNGGTVSQSGTGVPVGNPDLAWLAGNINLAANTTITPSTSTGTNQFLTILGTITNAASANITVGGSSANGSGTLVLAAQNTFLGAITVANATPAVILKLGVDNALPNTTTLTLNGGSSSSPVFDLNGHSTTISNLTLASGTTTGIVTNSAAGTTNTLTLGYNNATETLSNGAITDNPSTAGTVALTKIGTGTLTLGSAYSYSGDTTVSAGTLKMGASNLLPNGAGKGNLIVNGTLDLAGRAETINGLSGSGTIDTSGGTAGQGYVLTVGNNNASSTFSGTIQNTLSSAYVALTKYGTGTLYLTGNNSFNGNVLINTGAVWIASSSGLGSGTKTITIQDGADAELHLNGTNGNITLASGLSFSTGNSSGNGAIVNEAGANTINGTLSLVTGGSTLVTVNGGSLTLAGNINIYGTDSSRTLTLGGAANGTVGGVMANGTSGLLSVTKTGAGTWTLSNLNTYSGGTTISGGTLEVSGSIPGNVTNTAGTLKLDNSSALANTATLALASSPAAGTVNLNFSGTQTIGGLYFGSTSMAQGTWGASGSGATHQNAAFTGASGVLNVTAGGATPSISMPSVSPSPDCYGSPVSVAATVSGGSSPSGSVQFFDGATSLGTAPLVSGTATLNNVTLSVGTHGSITATYLGDNYNNQVTSSAGSVTVNALPATPTANNNGPVCAGTTLSLSTPTVANATYNWTGPNSYTSTAQNPTVSTSATTGLAGTYYVMVTTNGCASLQGSTLVTVNALPAIATDTTNQIACAGSEVTWSVVATGTGLGYQWQRDGTNLLEGVDNFTGTLTATLTNSAVAAQDVQNTNVLGQGYACVITNSTACSVTSTLAALMVNPLPTVSVNSATICAGGSTTLTAMTSASNPSYLWNDPLNSTTASITVSPASTTLYSVTVTDGTTLCANNGSGTVTVNPLPTVTITPDGPTTFCMGGSVGLTASGASTYNWSPGTGLSATTGASVTASPTTTQTYTVTGTDGNGCQNAAQVTVTVNPASTTNSVAASPNPSLPGADVTFTATVGVVAPCTGTPTGTVQFTANDAPLGAPVALDTNGLAVLITNSLPHGSNTVTAEYAGNANSLGSTNSIAQIVNTPPIAPNTNAGVTENTTLVFDGTKLLLLSYDADGDPLSITSAGPTSTNGGTVTLAGTNITYVPVTNFVGTDLFSFVVSDPYGGSGTGTVLVTVTAASVPVPNIRVPPSYDGGSGTFSVTFAGIPGYSYTIQYSPNVTGGPWTTLTNLTADADGLFQLIDTESPPPPQRYYRTVYP